VSINNILDYSKIEAGKLDIDLKPTEVRQVVHSLIAFFHPQGEEKRNRTALADPLVYSCELAFYVNYSGFVSRRVTTGVCSKRSINSIPRSLTDLAERAWGF